ncbi:MAG TPA: hypothetical protein VGC99_00380 [Candidatus Tectomicrobia bacterium]
MDWRVSLPIPLPADCHPVAVYLASHAPNSRHALRHALELAARLLTGGRFTADVLPWHELRYQHKQALRTASRLRRQVKRW